MWTEREERGEEQDSPYKQRDQGGGKERRGGEERMNMAIEGGQERSAEKEDR